MRIFFSGGSTGQTTPENVATDGKLAVMPSYVYTVKHGVPNDRLVSLFGNKRVRTFLDSGAHSLYNENVVDSTQLRKTAYMANRDIPTNILEKVVATEGCVPFENRESWRDRYKYYDSEECNAYIDEYCCFLKKFGKGLNHYVVVDAIFNPEKTWQLQKKMENEYGVNPVPIVHWGCDLKWVKKYIKEGYKVIGVGGLGQIVTRAQYEEWADKLFEYLCKDTGMPCVRTHGFAMTSLKYLVRYPWGSVDSASWQKLAGYGKIIIPRKDNGKFVFDLTDRTRMPMLIGISDQSNSDFHYHALSKEDRKVLDEWLEFVGVPLGDTKFHQKIDPLSGKKKRGYLRRRIRTIRMGRKNVSMEEEIEARGRTKLKKKKDGPIQEREGYGVTTEHHARCYANLCFFLEVEKRLTDNPVVFSKKKVTFGLSL